MEQLALREKEIFTTLNAIKNFEFIVIGGYAVNAYTQPRFSIDCDIVVKNDEELKKIDSKLIEQGYVLQDNTKLKSTPYYGEFRRYEKEIQKNFSVSMDILIGEVHDRQTDSRMTANWIFANSENKKLVGKTIMQDLNVKIVTVDALTVMKLLSCRKTDMRDIFMLATSLTDVNWIKKEVDSRYGFEKRMKILREYIHSENFRNSLQGPFGKIDEAIFQEHLSMIDTL